MPVWLSQSLDLWNISYDLFTGGINNTRRNEQGAWLCWKHKMVDKSLRMERFFWFAGTLGKGEMSYQQRNEWDYGGDLSASVEMTKRRTAWVYSDWKTALGSYSAWWRYPQPQSTWLHTMEIACFGWAQNRWDFLHWRSSVLRPNVTLRMTIRLSRSHTAAAGWQKNRERCGLKSESVEGEIRGDKQHLLVLFFL